VRFGTYYSDRFRRRTEMASILYFCSAIRQESLFSFVRSSAAASGLMQIILTRAEIALSWAGPNYTNAT
jgi:hypothetical protein